MRAAWFKLNSRRLAAVRRMHGPFTSPKNTVNGRGSSFFVSLTVSWETVLCFPSDGSDVGNRRPPSYWTETKESMGHVSDS